MAACMGYDLLAKRLLILTKERINYTKIWSITVQYRLNASSKPNKESMQATIWES